MELVYLYMYIYCIYIYIAHSKQDSSASVVTRLRAGQQRNIFDYQHRQSQHLSTFNVGVKNVWIYTSTSSNNFRASA